MKGVKYIGPIWDFSGYGEAARNYVLALNRAGVPVSVKPHCFDRNAPPVASDTERAILASLVDKDIECDVAIIHLTPDLAPAYVESLKDMYVISYTVWETSKLHPLWVGACNKVQEVWVPSQWNVDSFKASGVTVPILKVPHGIDPSLYSGVDPAHFESFGGRESFNFYSVFQWNARKNPEGLLRAYFNAFSGVEDVRLILKTYIGGSMSIQEEVKVLRDAVTRIKSDMRLPHFPKVSLITNTLSSDQMRALHLFGDAYVALPFGEGWGLGFMEAGLAGKPVIGTGAGGNMEFMTADNSFPVRSMESFVGGMGSFNPWYLGNQRWFQPDLIDAANKMRYVYENRAAAKERGLKLKQRISEEFNWDKVAAIMINRLKEL